MLDSKLASEIKDYIRVQPRTIQEISKRIKKSWLTADRYVAKISLEDGSILTKTFRGGTQGAIKIAYWNNTDSPAQSTIQERLFNLIINGKKKDDFSPFDIYQFIEEDKRHSFIERQKEEPTKTSKNVSELFSKAEKQILIFSGNLSWVNEKLENRNFTEVVEKLCKQGISFKIVTRVDILALKNVEKMLAINNKIGKDLIEIRHAEQPLRGFVVDDKVMQFKEIKNPEDYRKGELNEKTFIFYQMKNQEWVSWMERIFWHIFKDSISAKDRIISLNSIRNLRF